MREWLTFLAVVFGWALIGRLILELGIVHPVALAVVWFIGLIWLIGWAVGSAKEADYLFKIMAGLLGVPIALGVLLGIAESIFS